MEFFFGSNTGVVSFLAAEIGYEQVTALDQNEQHRCSVTLSLDTLARTTMNEMFTEAESFNGDLSKWNVSKVTDMSSMFTEAKSFNGDLSEWDVSNVTNTSGMFFYGADSVRLSWFRARCL
jgi:surface protein